MEDLNHLLQREQIELLKAQVATCPITADVHREIAGGIARTIRAHRHPYRTGEIKSRSAFAPYPFGGGGHC